MVKVIKNNYVIRLLEAPEIYVFAYIGALCNPSRIKKASFVQMEQSIAEGLPPTHSGVGRGQH